MDSILTEIKKLLGIEEDDTSFDKDIILDINTVFMILNQLGVGPVSGFRILDKQATWTSFLGTRIDIEGIKTYIYLKVRLMFDPPQAGPLIDAIKNQIAELEWRLNIQAETAIS